MLSPLCPRANIKGQNRAANIEQCASYNGECSYMHMQIPRAFAASYSSETRRRGSSNCANVPPNNRNQFWHARALTLTDRSPLSIHTRPHSTGSLQPLGKSVILALGNVDRIVRRGGRTLLLRIPTLFVEAAVFTRVRCQFNNNSG